MLLFAAFSKLEILRERERENANAMCIRGVGMKFYFILKEILFYDIIWIFTIVFQFQPN